MANGIVEKGVVGVVRGDRAYATGLLLNCRNQFGVLMSDVDVDELAREVKIFFTRLIPEVTALSLGDNDRANQALSRP